MTDIDALFAITEAVNIKTDLSLAEALQSCTHMTVSVNLNRDDTSTVKHKAKHIERKLIARARPYINSLLMIGATGTGGVNNEVFAASLVLYYDSFIEDDKMEMLSPELEDLPTN
jgi:protein subunit release factor A